MSGRAGCLSLWGQESGQSRRDERLGGLPGVSQLIVVAVAAGEKKGKNQSGRNENLLQAFAWAWKWFFVSLSPTTTPSGPSRPWCFSKILVGNGRWLCVALRRRQADKCWNVSYAIYHRALERRPSGSPPCPPVRLSVRSAFCFRRLVGSKLSARSMASFMLQC